MLSGNFRRTKLAVLISAFTMTFTASQTLFAQENPTSVSGETTTPEQEIEVRSRLETITVTGTRRGALRADVSSPTPIDVLSSASIQQANQVNLLQTLNNTLPSFNVPGLPTYGLDSVIKAGQLRGLNSSHVLVLVNGKRRHATARLGAGNFAASAPVDLGLIPTGSIERIEVLRDGASAIYGSDAIAGVINIITKKDDKGGSISARVGENYDGDGETQQYIGNIGFTLGNGGHLHLSAQWHDQEAAFRDGPVPEGVALHFPIDNITGEEVFPVAAGWPIGFGGVIPDTASANPLDAAIDRTSLIFGASGGIPESRLGAVTVDFGLPLNEQISLYGFASYADRTGRSPQHYRFPFRDQVVRAIHPNGFTPYSGVKEEDFSIQLGIEGDNLAGWAWDLSTVYGSDTIDTYIHNSVSPSYGLASKTDFFLGTYEYTSWTNNFDLTRTLDNGFLGLQTDVSFGVEYRREGYKRTAGEEQSWNHGGIAVLDGPNAGDPISISDAGSQADTGTRPEDASDDSRNSHAVYAGLSLYPTDDWVIDLAVRYEDYSDFGDITTGRISTRYDLSPGFAIRGTVSTGFQAPALAAQTYSNTNVTGDGTDHTLSVLSAEAQALGAKPLEPEESVNISFGVVLNPIDNVNLAIDAYQIKVDNRVSSLSSFSELTHPGLGVSALVQAASPNFGSNDGISYLINAGDTKTRGLDITLENVIDTDNIGSFRLTAAANWNKTELERVAPTPAVLAALNVPLYSAASQANLEYLAPRFKGILGVNWDLDKWSAGLTATRYGEIRRTTNVNINGVSTPTVYSVGDVWQVDLQIAYAFTRNLKLQLNANNLFDEKPPRQPDGARLFPFQSYSYLNNGPISPTGGFYSATLSYSW